MNGMIVLEIVISLVFIYLLYSLLASTIAEIWASRFGYRARNLERMIYRMLSDAPSGPWWVLLTKKLGDFLASFLPFRRWTPIASSRALARFYGHAMIQSLSKNQLFSKPSYIKPETFADVLVDLLEEEQAARELSDLKELFNADAVIQPADLRKHLQELIAHYQELQQDQQEDEVDTAEQVTALAMLKALMQELRQYDRSKPLLSAQTAQKLKLLYEKSQGDLEKFKFNLASWYEEMGERATGWYKKKLRMLTFSVGCVLAVMFNVDTLKIVDRLSTDEHTLERTMALIDSSRVVLQTLAVTDSIPAQQVDSIMTQRLDSIKKERENLAQILSISEVEVKDEYTCVLAEKCKDRTNLYAVLKVLTGYYSREVYVGWLLTALALSFGAQFWFDLLNKLMNLRSSSKLIASSVSSGTTAGSRSDKNERVGSAG